MSIPEKLSAENLADLRGSDLNDETIHSAGLYTITDAEKVRGLLGGYLSQKTARAMGPCLAFPYFDANGQLMTFANGDGSDHPYVRLKPAKPRKDRKKNNRPKKYESPLGASCRIYIPPRSRPALADPAIPLIISEGEKKVLCADQHGFACIGLSGVFAWQVKQEEDEDGNKIGPRELIPDLDALPWQGRLVYIVYDSDLAQNQLVQWAEFYLAEALKARGADVRVVRLPGGDGGDGGDSPAEAGKVKVGLDDFLKSHGPTELRKLLDAAVPPKRPEKGDSRPEIVIGTDEYRVNFEAVAALAPMPDLYQRAGMLARITKADEDPDPHAAVRRPPGAPVVRPLPPPLLRERMTYVARWVKVRPTTEGPKREDAHPPEWCVAAVHSRGTWPMIRHLEAVVSHPVLLPDGSILSANGYDKRSRLLVSVPSDLRLIVPDHPHHGHATKAVKMLMDVVGDFPFEKPEHKSAWLAGLLTPIAWFAFDGPAPMTLIDGNVRGVGKGLLADVIALIVTGRRFPVMSYSADKEELRKKITSLAMEGERLVLLDNLAGAVGNDVLDMALTADRWKDRVLGVNKVYDGPLHVAWYATGNNVQLHADTARRCSHVRLETDNERPELRADVRHADLRRHVRENRGPLLSAALTILRAWCTAGKPRHNLTPWGSFEGWSNVVREAVVFAGMPDPGMTRLALQTACDRDALTMTAMIDALERMDPTHQGKTTSEIIEAARYPDQPIPAEWYQDLRSAVEELCGKLDSRSLGYKFRHFARRNFSGRMIDKTGIAHGSGIRWAVFPAQFPARVKTSPPSPPSPPPDPPPQGGDEGDGGDVPAQAGIRPDGFGVCAVCGVRCAMTSRICLKCQDKEDEQ